MFYKISTENGDANAKREALKKLMYLILNGEKMPSLLISVIRYLLPMKVISKSCSLYKLLTSYSSKRTTVVEI